MNPKSIIRRARKSDLDALVGLVQQYLKFYDVAQPRRRVAEFIASRLRSRPVLIWVAAKSSAIGAPLDGFVQVYSAFSTLRLGRTWILNDLFVVPAARGTGTGRALCQTVLDEAARARVKNVELMTAVTNSSARRLYDSLGFTADDEFLTYSRTP